MNSESLVRDALHKAASQKVEMYEIKAIRR